MEWLTLKLSMEELDHYACLLRMRMTAKSGKKLSR